MNCTFFGHHDCPASIKTKLLETIEHQIEQGTTEFYVGNNGNFDAITLSCLRELKEKHNNICYTVVLAYLPDNLNAYMSNETLFPEGIELVPKRYAIDFRNRWMIAHANTVIAYISNPWGKTNKYVQKAKNKGAIIINITDASKAKQNPATTH